MLELNGKDFVIVIVKIFKKVVEMKKRVDKQIKHFSHKKRISIKNQMEIPKLKNTISKITNLLKWV